jgi:hypothetical protein
VHNVQCNSPQSSHATFWASALIPGQRAFQGQSRAPKGEKKKGGDGGIDGEQTLVDRKGMQRRGLVSVKGGRTLTPDFVEALSQG